MPSYSIRSISRIEACDWPAGWDMASSGRGFGMLEGVFGIGPELLSLDAELLEGPLLSEETQEGLGLA